MHNLVHSQFTSNGKKLSKNGLSTQDREVHKYLASKYLASKKR